MLVRRRSCLALAAGAAMACLVRRDGWATEPSGPGPLAEAELAQAARNAALCSSANVAGVGLRGEYFADEGCRGAPLLVRLDGAVDFDVALDWPAEQGPRPRSVRWSGWVKAAITGAYRFHAGAVDARIQVARHALAGAGAPAQASIDLAAGRFYPIAVTLDRIPARSQRIRLEWTAPHGARFAVPRALLYLPTEGLRPAVA